MNESPNRRACGQPDSRKPTGRRRIRGAPPGALMHPPKSSASLHAPELRAEAKPVLRCFVYCRKSTDDEARQVASIESQRLELEQRFGASPDLEIVGIYEEARTAKTPGRPVFGEMLMRIERGEADCIVAWAPDRLARNSIDGGHIIYLLDRGVLRDLKFATYTFENNSQGKFMLSIMFGQSKYYSDALSENVKRGNRTKAAKGWRPGAAPMGYLNDPASKTIIVDPTYYPLVRQMFDLVLTGGHSAKQIARIAREDWGLTTPRRRKGGGVVHQSLVHRVLTNPFYAGLFMWEGQLVRGQHEPVVTLDEFKAVQAAIRRPDTPRPKRHAFPFVGLIRCGECGMGVTAQVTTNRFGTRYTYYRCTKKALGTNCSQPSIRAEELERQILEWLAALPEGGDAEKRLRQRLSGLRSQAAGTARAIRQSIESALRETRTQLSELLQLRLGRLIGDEEFRRRRADLQFEAQRLARKLDELNKPDDWLKPLETAMPLGIYAADWFRTADDQLKRMIVKATGSNLTLIGKALSIEAAKWLSLLSLLTRGPIGLGVRDDAKTSKRSKFLKSLELLHTDDAATAQLLLALEVVRMVSGSRGEDADSEKRAA